MTQPVVKTHQTDGAAIYHEIRGDGAATLLIIPGGPQDAGVFAGLADELADEYKVVTYDPRGNSRTVSAVPLGDLVIEQQAEDAAALIRATGQPAHVFGTSGGAQIALALAARYPELVRTVVAHEPPAAMALDNPEKILAKDRALVDTYHRDGVEAAMSQFFSENGLDESAEAGPGPEMSPEETETFARVSGNFEYWLSHGMMPLTLYTPDVAALRSGKPQVIVAVGEKSSGQQIAEMGEALAAKLGRPPVRFPGDHMGFASQTQTFARALRNVLSDETTAEAGQ
jgi:pimeloyl-ACP methyl ester carboxylesterase